MSNRDDEKQIKRKHFWVIGPENRIDVEFIIDPNRMQS